MAPFLPRYQSTQHTSSSQGAPVASRYPASQPRCPADPSPRSSDACKDVQGGLHAEFLSPVGIVPGERQEPEAAIGERGHAPISDLSEQFLGFPDQRLRTLVLAGYRRREPGVVGQDGDDLKVTG